METISNIQLIDASRPTSVEAQSNVGTGNNSQWTNTASHGLRLNPGDQVSVSSVFINTAGAGSSSLETTGKIVGTVNYKYSKQTFSQPHDVDLKPIMGDSVNPADFQYEIGPYGCDVVDSKETTLIKNIKDNEFNVVVSYYKNTNGENYIHLPRKYCSRVDALSEDIPYDEYGTASLVGPTGYKKRDEARRKLWFQADDKVNGRPEDVPLYRCHDDYHWYKGLKSYAPKSGVIEKGALWQSEVMPSYGNIKKNGTGGNDMFYDTNMWKQKNDNKRYTIYTAEKTMFSLRDKDIFLDNFGGLVGDAVQGTYSRFQPCFQRFNKYRELKEYEVTKGYNDPHNVAYQLTSKFSDPILGPLPIVTQTKNFDPALEKKAVPTDEQTVPPYPANVTTNSNGETFKPFAAATYDTMSIQNYVTWYGWAGGTGASDDAQAAPSVEWATATDPQMKQLIDYYSSYNMIGVKRPEVWDAGRALTENGLINDYNASLPDPPPAPPAVPIPPINTETISNLYTSGKFSTGGSCQPTSFQLGEGWGSPMTYTSNWLRTRIPWNKTTLGLFRDLFAAQRLYPELLDFKLRDQSTFGLRSTDDKSGNAFTDLYKMDTPPIQYALNVKLKDHPAFLADSPFAKRFLHMGGPGLNAAGEFNQTLGSDLTEFNSATNLGRQSCPIWFYFDELMKDTYVENPTTETGNAVSSNNLCYGFAYKDIDNDGKEYITFNTQGLPRGAQEKGPIYMYGNDGILGNRTIGWDWHFNAYGTSAIQLFSGWVPQDYDMEHSTGLSTQGNDVVGVKGDIGFGGGPTVGPGLNGTNYTTGGYTISKLLRQVYLGAIDPLITFTDSNSRFTIQNLHTPEQIQNPANAGKYTDPTTQVPVLADAGTNVYKINKKLTLWNNFTPEMCPYRSEDTFKAPFYPNTHSVVQEEGGATSNRYSSAVGGCAGRWKTPTHGGGNKGYIAQGNGSATGQSINSDWSDDVANPGTSSLAGDSQGRFQSAATTFKITAPQTNFWEVQNTMDSNVRAIDIQQEYYEQNQNLEEFVVYDSHCGIFLEDFGITDIKIWKKSLFGIMGWSYNQFNPGVNTVNRQSKLTRVNYKTISPLTTNADIPQKDLTTQIKNGWQKTMYSLQVPCPLLTNLWYGHTIAFFQGHGGTGAWAENFAPYTEATQQPNGGERYAYLNGDINQPQILPLVVNPQNSMSIICENLPTKMKSPYYLIKSSIIASQANYIKDKSPLPIVAVANKENLFGDFAFSNPTDMIFTVQEPSFLTEIVTEVYDSDMSPAIIDENSSVIYKIVKSIQKDPNLVATLLKNNGEPKPKTMDWNTQTEKVLSE